MICGIGTKYTGPVAAMTAGGLRSQSMAKPRRLWSRLCRESVGPGELHLGVCLVRENPQKGLNSETKVRLQRVAGIVLGVQAVF